MGAHLVNGEFQSDKYPTCPPGKVPLSVKDQTAQDLLWEYARRRHAVDKEFAVDLETALRAAGFIPAEERDRLLLEAIDKLERCIIRSGTDPEFAAEAVKKYRDAMVRDGSISGTAAGGLSGG